MSSSFDNTLPDINEKFNCILNIKDLCLKHIVKSLTKLELQKGISVCFTDWDTNSNKEQDNMYCVKIINFIKDTLLQIKEKALINFEYTDRGLDITLKKDAIEFTIHFKTHPLKTEYIFDEIDEFRLGIDEFRNEYEEIFNLDVEEVLDANNISTPGAQSELPLFVIIIDTNNPLDGQLHEIKEEEEIRSSVMAFILERFDQD